MQRCKASRKRGRDKQSNVTDSKSLRRPMTDGPDLDSKIVSVLVGKERQRFYVHETCIRSSSAFFENALNGNSIEASTRTVPLPVSEPIPFAIYFRWLYCGRFYNVEADDVGKSDQVDQDQPDDEWSEWEDCYKLGDFLQDNDFKDALIDLAIEKMCSDRVLDMTLIEVIYANSGASSSHRKLALDIAALLWTNGDLQALHSDKPYVQFLRDALALIGPDTRKRYIRSQGIKRFLNSKDLCEYHDHNARNALCYKEKHK
ncbi:uncharacterized protein K460DRAFT_397494 [Cucurbitaria berberidis CBS 394.84]|uniref:BTB domain-containing protein n=1 Tax=Cucurbitaria berberidis CBS 394.84 TaxID=1168544 RepID=A0A9P4L706_9PLEO|nr:uncharacterized protein K460DRAFT_397494 [Cucurbitaria berberidis CBS 394.84]KAF1844385.1 hypothetical protein K460DRAFT_397494 [Cucurbitaria berberidis CBS 394.84]